LKQNQANSSSKSLDPHSAVHLRPSLGLLVKLGEMMMAEMTQLVVVVKPFRAEAVLLAVAEMGTAVRACLVREAKGYGRQKGYLDRYRGSEYSMAYLPKVEITLWVESHLVVDCSERIAKAARTGRIGDGKVFAVPAAWPTIEF
jgi:nitrogen regulatory protein PII